MNKNEAIELINDFFYTKMMYINYGTSTDVLYLLSRIVRAFDGRRGAKSNENFNKDIIEAFNWDVDSIYNLDTVQSGILQTILYQLERSGVITHSSSVYRVWLTFYGDRLIEAFDICDKEDCLIDVLS